MSKSSLLPQGRDCILTIFIFSQTQQTNECVLHARGGGAGMHTGRPHVRGRLRRLRLAQSFSLLCASPRLSKHQRALRAESASLRAHDTLWAQLLGRVAQSSAPSRPTESQGDPLCSEQSQSRPKAARGMKPSSKATGQTVRVSVKGVTSSGGHTPALDQPLPAL